jgi:hypothetical protein
MTTLTSPWTRPFSFRYTRMLSTLLGIWILYAGLAALQCSGQTFGEITGVVKDPSGAVAAGAPVSVVNADTNVARTTATNDVGIYTVPSLPPGRYQVRVSAPGFDPVVRTNIELQVQQTARVDFTLTVGQSSQTVEISAAAVALTTDTASVGTVVEERSINDLPLNGRDFFQLVSLSPNVNYGFTAASIETSRQGGTRSLITMSLSGARQTWSNYTLDGIENTDVNFNTYIVLPSIDALQEFKVQTGIYPAEFGRNVGQVNVSTKPGTNGFHGTAYEFLRNDVLDANQYNFSSAVIPKSPYRQNQYGYTLGGPVWIPKLFNGKNRLFFMSNFEGFKSRLTQEALFTTIPQSFRNGDFSSVAPLLDPNTRSKLANGTFTATPFQGNQIPITRFNSYTVSMLKYDPVPNVPGAGLQNNFQEPLKTPVDKNQVNERIDWAQSANSQWFGRYSWTGERALTPGMTVDGTTVDTHASQWMVSNTRIFSPTKVNEARFGYSNLYNLLGQQLGGIEDVDKELAIPLPVSPSTGWGVPAITLSNGLTGFGNNNNGPYVTNDKIVQGIDNFSWTLGRHSLRMGGDYRYDTYPQTGNEYTRGQFAYNGYFTSNPTTLAGGNGAADFLLGAVYQSNMPVTLAQDQFSASGIGAYIDDTWKVTPKLTVTLGLRWEVEQPFYDALHNETNIRLNFPGIPNIANDPNMAEHPVLVRSGTGAFYEGINFVYVGATVPGFPIAPLQTARDGSMGSRMIQTAWLDFAPRIGIAYSPNSKWVFRTGFGIFYDQDSKNSIFDMERSLAGRATSIGNYGQNLGPPNLTMQNFISASQFPIQIAPGTIWGTQYNLPITYSEEFLLNVQRQFGSATTLEAGYTGVLDRHLLFLNNSNAPIPGTSNVALRSPYPEFNTIEELMAGGTGNYNAGSLKLTQRFSSGFSALLGYTYAKALDDGSAIRGVSNDQYPENPRCVLCSYGPSEFDVRQRFTASVLYALPFGHGKPFLNHGGIVNALVGGWQTSGIFTKQTGPPINTTAWDSAGTGESAPSNRLNATGVSPYLSNPSPNQWFNPAAFSNPVAATYGTMGRDSITGPALTNFDFSALKDFAVTEHQRLQLRVESFNIVNHPNWQMTSGSSWGGSSATAAATFNKITSTINGNNSMRQIQFALKYIF